MNLKTLFGKARKQAEDAVEKRGGTEALKADAAELKDIAKGEGSIKDKAKRAADALKEPGAKDVTPPSPTEPATTPGPTEPPTTPGPTEPPTTPGGAA